MLDTVKQIIITQLIKYFNAKFLLEFFNMCHKIEVNKTLNIIKSKLHSPSLEDA